jgi:hypothetical protein
MSLFNVIQYILTKIYFRIQKVNIKAFLLPIKQETWKICKHLCIQHEANARFYVPAVELQIAERF